MKKYFTFVSFLLAKIVVGQDFTMYQMQHVYQSAYINPAAIPDQKVSFALLSGSLRTGLVLPVTLKQLSTDENGTVTQSSIRNALQNSTNLLALHLENELFHFRVKARTTYISFDVNSIFNTYMFIPDDISKLTDGTLNSDNTGRKIDFKNMGLDVNHYMQYAIGFTRETRKFNYGIRAKFLQGLSNISFETNEAYLDFERNMYDIRFVANGTLRSSVGTSASLTELDLSKLASAFIEYYTNFKNLGYGMDFGLTYKITKNLHINATANNIGFITWRKNVSQYDLSTGVISFTGIDIGKDLFAGNTAAGTNFLDSLSNAFSPRKSTTQSYTTLLLPNFYLGFRYYITPRVDLFFTAHAINYKKLFLGGTVGAQVKLSRIFSLAANASYMYNALQFGVGFTMKLAAFQWYIAADNVYLQGAPVTRDTKSPMRDVMVPVDNRYANFRTGLNYVFSRNALNQKQPFDKD